MITLKVQDNTRLTATALDQFGNEISDVVFTWSAVDIVGSIDETGIFSTGTEAGTYKGLNNVTATQGVESLEALVDVTITPGPLSTVMVEPSETTIDIGAIESFTVVAFDEFGNGISDAIPSWSAASEAGTINTNGGLTTGTKAGAFQVRVDVAHGTARASATADVSIEPDPVASIDVLPSFAVVEKGGSQQFEAVGFDQHGNEISDLAFIWEATGGETTQGGLFTAGGQSGAYELKVAATFKDNSRSGSATIPIPPVWIPVGNMLVARAAHDAVLLPDGKVLIVSQRAELYDPITLTFTVARNARCANGWGSRATLLADGRVLITGGQSEPRCAEIYDSETDAFSRVGDLNADHWQHGATLLSDGRVLVVGGLEGVDGGEMTHAMVEIYDPVTETFSVTGSLNTDRKQPTVTSLPSGQALITGGHQYSSPFIYGSDWPGVCVASPELYDPSSGNFSVISVIGGVLSACGHSATLLNSGKVLLTSNAREAWLFNPVTGTFDTAGTMTTGRGFATASLLPNGQVLITGGWSTFPLFLATAELYDPVAGTFTATDDMSQTRQEHTATLLSNGYVLVAGGQTLLTTSTGESAGQKNVTSAEIWIPSEP